MSLLGSDVLLAGFPTVTPGHLHNPSSTDSGKPVPIFFHVHPLLFLLLVLLHETSWIQHQDVKSSECDPVAL